MQRPRILAHLLAAVLPTLILLGAGFAGCFAGPDEITVVRPRLGDQVTFDVRKTFPDIGLPRQASQVERVNITLLDTVDLTLPDGQNREAVRILQETAILDEETGALRVNLTHWIYLDRDSLRVLKWTHTCTASVKYPSSCSPIVHSYAAQGQSWGYGSAILHGQTLRVGEVLGLEERVAGQPVPVEVRFQGRAARDSYLVTMMPATERAPAVPLSGFFQGNVTLSPGNPYIQTAEFLSFILHPDRSRPTKMHAQVEQIKYIPGQGAELAATSRAPDWTCGTPTIAWDGILPPGSGYRFPGLNLSFKEFTDYLEGSDPDFQKHAGAPSAIVESISLRLVRGVGSPLGLFDEREYRASIIVPVEDGTARSIQVAKRVDYQLVPPGERTRYFVADESTEGTVVPPRYPRVPLVPVGDVATLHAASARGHGEELRSAALRATPVLGTDGGVALLRTTLEFTHGERFSSYDLATGCLVEHQPGTQNQPG